MTTVLLVDDAERQLRDVVAWWSENRPAAPNLVVEEFANCIELLESSPDAGVRVRRAAIPGVRRMLMPRTRHHVYYVHDETHGIVYVLAVWGAPRAAAPPLSDPR